MCIKNLAWILFNIDEDFRIARQVAEWNPQGRRNRGRPANTCKGGIRNSME
jgi:hypothetical protein